MTVTFRVFSQGSTFGASPRTTSKPGAVVDGDLILLACQLANAIAPTSIPSGFTLVASSGVTDTPSIYIYAKLAEASDPANFSFSFASGSGIVTGLFLYSSTALPLAVDVAAAQKNASSTDRIWPSVVTSAAAFLAFFGIIDGNFATTPPGGTTERLDISNTKRGYLMTESVGAAGATGTRTGTGTAVASSTSTIAVIEVSAVAGAAALTLDALTLAAAGNVPITGSAAIALADVSAAAAGSVPVVGAAALGLGALTLGAVGTTPPPAPTGLSAVAVTASRINLSWVHEGVGIDGFSIERSTSEFSGFAEIDTVAADVRSYSAVGLAENVRYYFRIRAFRT